MSALSPPEAGEAGGQSTQAGALAPGRPGVTLSLRGGPERVPGRWCSGTYDAAVDSLCMACLGMAAVRVTLFRLDFLSHNYG